MSNYPEILSGAEITALEFPHWDSEGDEPEVEEFSASFDALMAELDTCTECHNGLCMRCGGLSPCCEDCSWSGLCRGCNGTGLN